MLYYFEMYEQQPPNLVTCDGEARTGKGTMIQATKDFLRDKGQKVMLIDAGQVFRVLAVVTHEAGVNLENPEEIGSFLGSEPNIEIAARRVKEVYHLTKEERDQLIYTDEVGANSAKIGAQSRSQEFKDVLLEKWMRDAGEEKYDTVLLDGRALELVGKTLAEKKLCNYVLGLFSICDELVGARRTRGFAHIPFNELPLGDKENVLTLAEQIRERNRKDQERLVQPLVRPAEAPIWRLGIDETPPPIGIIHSQPPIVMIDTSAEISREDMSRPVAKFVAGVLNAYNSSTAAIN